MNKKDNNKTKKSFWIKFKEWLLSDNLNAVAYVVRIIWYCTCMLACIIYVKNNWNTLSQVNFYDGVTLESVVFLFMIALATMPFIKKFDILGVKVETNNNITKNNEEILKIISDDVLNKLNNKNLDDKSINNINQKSKEEILNQLEKSVKLIKKEEE